MMSIDGRAGREHFIGIKLLRGFIPCFFELNRFILEVRHVVKIIDVSHGATCLRARVAWEMRRKGRGLGPRKG